MDYQLNKHSGQGRSSTHLDALSGNKRARQEKSRQDVLSGAARQEDLFFFPQQIIRGVSFQYKE